MTELSDREHLLLEAAQCLWEFVLDSYSASWDKETDSFNNPNVYVQYWNESGAAQARYVVRSLAPDCLDVFDYVEDWFGECYDWGFCPWFMINCVQPTGDWLGVAFALRPDWRLVCDKYKVVAELQKSECLWMQDAKRACVYYWSYSDLLSEHAETISNHCNSTDPFECIRKLGESLELHKIGPFFETPWEKGPNRFWSPSITGDHNG